MAYRGFWWRLQSPIRTIAQTSDILQRARAAASRIVELLEAPIAIVDAPGAVDVKAGGGQIEFKGVHFAYDPSKPILKGVDLKIAAGEFVAVAGSSGAGKSTLLNLIPRFYAADQGRICLDGVNIEQCRLASLRSEIAYVGQEHYLFDTTIGKICCMRIRMRMKTKCWKPRGRPMPILSFNRCRRAMRRGWAKMGSNYPAVSASGSVLRARF